MFAKTKYITFFFIVLLFSLYSFHVGKSKIFPYYQLKVSYHILKDVIKSPQSFFNGDKNQKDFSSSINLKNFWKTAKINFSELNEENILNNFIFNWKRIEVNELRKVGAAQVKGNQLFYVNQDSNEILVPMNLEDKILYNGGIKALFTHDKKTFAYIVYSDGECSTGKLVSLDNQEVLFKLKCLPTPNIDLNGSGGAILKLNEKLILMSTGTPTTDYVSSPINLQAQDRMSYWGKILQIDLSNHKPNIEIYSSGHRNPQGIAMIDNKIFSVEHGPMGGDEINVIEKNNNYGWPYQSFGSEYDFFEIDKLNINFSNHNLPLYTFVPSIGISHISKCPKAYDNYYKPFKCLAVSSMRGNSIFFVVYKNNKVFFTERMNFGSRIRKLFVNNNQMILVTDFEGLIVGEIKKIF